MSEKDLYIKKFPSSFSVFASPKWLDVLCENNWDVVLYLENDSIIAALPFLLKSARLGKVICQPPLTPFLEFNGI